MKPLLKLQPLYPIPHYQLTELGHDLWHFPPSRTAHLCYLWHGSGLWVIEMIP